MSSNQQSREELDARARRGETVIPGGTGGKSLEAQEHLAEGRSRGGQTRKEQLGTEGYQEMGRKGGLSTTGESGGARVKVQDQELNSYVCGGVSVTRDIYCECQLPSTTFKRRGRFV